MQWSRRSAAVLGPTGAVPPGGTAGARDVGNVGTENTPVGSHPIWGALIRLVVDRPDGTLPVPVRSSSPSAGSVRILVPQTPALHRSPGDCTDSEPLFIENQGEYPRLKTRDESDDPLNHPRSNPPSGCSKYLITILS